MFMDVQHKAQGRARMGLNAQEVEHNTNLRLFMQHWLKVWGADRIFDVPVIMPRPSKWFNHCWARRQRHQVMLRRMKKKMYKNWLVKNRTQVPILVGAYRNTVPALKGSAWRNQTMLDNIYCMSLWHLHYLTKVLHNSIYSIIHSP